MKMPRHKKRGKPLDLVVDENEVSQELAQELINQDTNDVKVTKSKKAKRK